MSASKQKKSKKMLRSQRNPNHHDPEITHRNKMAHKLKVLKHQLTIVSARLVVNKPENDEEAWTGFKRIRAELGAMGIEV